MNLLEIVAANPAVGLITAGFALGALVVFRVLRQGPPEPVKETLPGLDELLAAGRYRDAAMLCLRYDHLAEAQEFFLRAQDPGRAAQVAQRLGNHRLAAQLYERAGDPRRAAACHDRAGNGARARELLAAADPRGGAAPRQRAATNPGTAPAKRGAGNPRETAVTAKIGAKQRAAEERFRVLLAKGPSDDAARLEMQQVAQQAADESLAAGEIRKAAEIFRDAGLSDEAIHLFANVLGLPGEAAALVAARGHHDRAAELYELAGMKDRAAAAWADLARKEGRVEAYAERVERLDPRAALKLLEEAAAAKPAPDAPEVHYRLGRVLEGLGERPRALEVMTALQRAVPGYRDVDARVRALGGAPPEAAPAKPSSAHVTRVVVQNPQLPSGLRPEDVQQLAREAALAAASHVRQSSVPPAMEAGARAPRSGVVASPSRVTARGLESAPVAMELLADEEVRAAREGPSLESLRRFVGDARCSLSNIEVFFRMGLACLAAGDWAEALKHFEAVEEASPGYRDALHRAEEIRRWKRSMGPKISLAGGVLQEGAPASSSRYTVQGEVGRGGMAVVYRATDTVLGRDVALKFIGDDALTHKEFREMFLREARSVAQLNHPNIVTIYDVGTLDGRTFLAMELVEGRTVDQLVAAQGRLPVVEALRIAQQVLAALEYAHGRQIIHRDIKPSNMMRTSTGMVKLMDFGLAKSVTAGTKTSMIAGTPAYMPPEQFTGRNVDHRADIYSVGASLYEMLTGVLPFEGAARVGAPRPARSIAPQVPALVDEALRTALDADPSRRFASAREFAAPLQRVLAVFDRAMEERLMAHAPDAPAAAPEEPPAAARATVSFRNPLKAKPPQREEPADARLPSLPPLPGARPGATLPPTAPASVRPASMSASYRPPAMDASNLKATAAFNAKKSTLLMHAAPGAPDPSPRAAAVATPRETAGAGVRKATMLVGPPRPEDPPLRTTFCSSVPPPA